MEHNAVPPLPRPPASRVRRLGAALAAYGVQAIFFGIWICLGWLLYVGLVIPVLGHSPEWIEEIRRFLWEGIMGRPPSKAHMPGTPYGSASDVALASAIAALCLFPKVVSFCLALLLKQLGIGQLRYRLQVPKGAEPSCTARVLADWDHEQKRARAGLLRMTQHAGLFGLVASITLTICTLLLYNRGQTGLRYSASFTVVAAVSASFIIHLSRILLRAAHRDASARMFAWATRGELLAIIGALMLVTLLREMREPLLGSAEGFLMAGVAVAFFGERFLTNIAERAVRALGMPEMPRRSVDDLPSLGGLSEADLQRLAEEGVETLHSLAYSSTARLFFSLPYSLQRITQWQDEALLSLHLGGRARSLREQLHIGGALGALRLHERLSKRATELSELEELEGVARGLGFVSLEQARLALSSLREDEAVRRLEIYASSGVERLAKTNA